MTKKVLHPLAILYTLFVGIGILWAILIPPFEKPDEIHHVVYIQFVAQEGRLPVQKQESWGGLLDFEAHQPPLYYVVGAIVYRTFTALGVEPHQARDWQSRINPNFVGKTQGPDPEQTFFVHDGTIFQPDRLFPYNVILLRIYSVLVASVGVVGTYLTCRQIWPQQRWPSVLTTSLIVFVPQISFITSSTTNDAMVYAVGSLLIYQMVRIVRHGRSEDLAGYALLGILLGVSILTKLSLVSFIPIAALLPLLAGERSPRRWLTVWLVMAVGCLLVSGWWFVRNWMLYQEWLGSHWHVNPEAFAWDFDPKPLFSEYFGLHGFWLWVGHSFVGRFGFMHLDMQTTFYQIYLMIFVFGVAVFLLSSLRKDGILPLPLKFLLVLLIAAAVAQLVVLNLSVSQPQGRYLFHVSSAISIVVAAGIGAFGQIGHHLLKQRRAGRQLTVLRPSPSWQTGLLWGLALIHPAVNLLVLQHIYAIYAVS